MAQKSYQSQVVSLPTPQIVGTPLGWQKAETALTRVRILTRDPSVGKIDFSKIITREWSGYWYSLQDRHIIESGTLAYKNQQIYQDVSRWHLEGFAQQSATRAPIPETTQPEENFEEVAELALYAGEITASLADTVNLPFVGDLLTALANAVAAISSDDLYYLPQPLRPDEFVVDFPAGKVTAEIEFLWVPYSPLAVGGGLAELPTEPLIDVPTFPVPLQDPFSPVPEIDFDAAARAAGYIFPSECGDPPSSATSYKQYTVSWSGEVSGSYDAYINVASELATGFIDAPSGVLTQAVARAQNPLVVENVPTLCLPLSGFIDPTTTLMDSYAWTANIVLGGVRYTLPLITSSTPLNITINVAQAGWESCNP